MEQQASPSAKQEFDQKLEELSKQEAPAHYSNDNSFVVLYEKLVEIERKLDEMKKS